MKKKKILIVDDEDDILHFLELVLREKVPMVVVRPGRRGDQPGASARLLFTPTRPGLVLSEARARRLPVG